MRIHYNQTRGFCDRLNHAIDEKKINCVELGDRVGVDRKTVYTWTGGYMMPNGLILARLCHVLGVSADYLLFGEQKKIEGNETMAEEKLFEGRLKKWLHSIGVYPAGYGEDQMNVPIVGWYTKIWGGGYQKSGIPDMICCIKGQFVSIEVKAQTGRPSELQKLNTNRIRDSGGHGVFLYPSGFEQFKTDLNNMLEELKYDSFCYQLQEVYK